MASDGLVEIPDGTYQLVTTSKYHLVVSGGKAFIAPSGPSKPISDLFPDGHSPSPALPAAPSKVMLFLKEHGQKLLIGVLIVMVLIFGAMHFHPSVPWQPVPTPTPPGPPPRPPWVPPGPPDPPAPTPNPQIRRSQADELPTAEPGPEPVLRKGVRQ